MLKQYSFSLDRAADAIFSGDVKLDSSNVAAIQKIFRQYADADEKEISIDGTIQFIQDLGLELEDPVVLAVVKELSSPAMGRFPKQGFVSGWSRWGVASLQDMQNAVQTMGQRMREDEKYFTEVYRFTFKFNLQDEGQRVLQQETAIDYWKLLLADRFPILDKWIKFVQEEYKRGISKDTWNMIWDFAKYYRSDPNLEAYDDEAAWPSVIDEFVEYLKA